MKYCILVFGLLLSILVHSQITISSEDMPAANNNYVFSNGNLFFDVNLDPGADMNWDYGDLESVSQDSLQYVTISGAPFAYQFLFNNPFIPEYLANHALQTPDVDLGGFAAFENIYAFFQNNPDSYLGLGAGLEVNSVPGVGTSNPIDTIYNFPMNFNNQDTSYTELNIQIPGLYTYHQELSRINHVDGWGTLSLPIGDFECLRIKSIVDATDSIFSNLLDFGISIPRPTVTEYKWLANGEGSPVLHINESAGFISQIQYRDEVVVIPDNISEIASIKVSIWPNPTQDQLNISLEQSIINDYLIVDRFGRLISQVKGVNEGNLILDLSGYSSGSYKLLMNTSSGMITEMFTKL